MSSKPTTLHWVAAGLAFLTSVIGVFLFCVGYPDPLLRWLWLMAGLVSAASALSVVYVAYRARDKRDR